MFREEIVNSWLMTHSRPILVYHSGMIGVYFWFKLFWKLLNPLRNPTHLNWFEINSFRLKIHKHIVISRKEKTKLFGPILVHEFFVVLVETLTQMMLVKSIKIKHST